MLITSEFQRRGVDVQSMRFSEARVRAALVARSIVWDSLSFLRAAFDNRAQCAVIDLAMEQSEERSD